MTATAGRYRDIARAPVPGTLPDEGRPQLGFLEAPRKDRKPRSFRRATERTGERTAVEGVQLRHGVAADPNPALQGKRQRVAINIRTDALEREYAHKRISDAAYAAARQYKRILEQSRRPISASGAWNPGDKVDVSQATRDGAMVNRLEAAQAANEMIADTAPAVGMRGQRVLELVLVDEVTLTQVAQQMSGGDDRQAVIYYSQLFRDSCEALAEHWCQRDRRPPR